MNTYKEATRLKLRISTIKGPLSVEQLWDLRMDQLDKVAIRLQKELEESGTKSFLTEETKENKLTKLKFEVVLDVLKTKMAAAESAKMASELRAHNQRINELIARKKDEELEGKSIEELEALLK